MIIKSPKKNLAQSFKLPPKIEKLLWEKCKEAKIKYNSRLVGHIQEEYQLNVTDEMRNYFFSVLNEGPIFERRVQEIGHFYDDIEKPKYRTKDGRVIEDYPFDIKLGDVWVNFQKKNEFNPIHKHAGILSFVVFLSIPFTREEEDKFAPPSMREKPKNGNFNFIHYTDDYHQNIELAVPVDKTWNGTGLLFESGQRHYVYPFYSSDDYRITISGNFYLKRKN